MAMVYLLLFLSSIVPNTFFSNGFTTTPCTVRVCTCVQCMCVFMHRCISAHRVPKLMWGLPWLLSTLFTEVESLRWTQCLPVTATLLRGTLFQTSRCWNCRWAFISTQYLCWFWWSKLQFLWLHFIHWNLYLVPGLIVWYKHFFEGSLCVNNLRCSQNCLITRSRQASGIGHYLSSENNCFFHHQNPITASFILS